MSLKYSNIEDHLNKLSEKIIEIDFYLKTLSDIYSCFNHSERKGVIEGSFLFYSGVIDSFWRSSIIDLWSFFDLKSDSGIESLKKTSDKFISLSRDESLTSKFPKIQESFEIYTKNLANYSISIENIKRQRNKYWVHWDKMNFKNPKELFEKFPISLNDLVDLNEFAKRILESLNSSVLNTSLKMEFYDSGQALRIIDIVNNEHKSMTELSDLDA